MVKNTNITDIIEKSFDILEFNHILEDDLITCENCGHKWDGWAQCMCLGEIISDYEDELIQEYVPQNNIFKDKKQKYIMTSDYMDEIVIHEYGNYTNDDLNKWLELWMIWTKSD